ncbi:MAG: hypothetical protein P1U70_20810 [Saprospiraceae bacterium]|jgi:putative endonuclease|nr:hypothetical protein [Saprospiraceae bacterium]
MKLAKGAKTISLPNISCYNLLWYEWHQYVNNAIAREKQIKGWLRSKEERLITDFNPTWRFLNDEVMKGEW